MSEFPSCPKCNMDNTYFDGVMNVCPDCGHEWTGSEEESAQDN
ncbi:MAG: alkylphosphonate utilization protein, partial [Bacteroidota bacterium]|nr:alkylphosphonate utilization protein [Bacteroidota bacterium]